jgi:hypothetical protein
MTTPTLAQALAAADANVRAVCGQSHPSITRAAVRGVLALQDGNLPGPATASGWSGIRDEQSPVAIADGDQEPAETVMVLQALIDVILSKFSEGKDGHWRAHVGASQMTEWRDAVGGSGG